LSLGENGIYEKAQFGAKSYTNAQVKEQTEISKMTNDIDSLVSTRVDSSKGVIFESLINKNDGVYNTNEKGYLFSTNTSGVNYSSNNIITLTKSIENYDYLIIEFDVYRDATIARIWKYVI